MVRQLRGREQRGRSRQGAEVSAHAFPPAPRGDNQFDLGAEKDGPSGGKRRARLLLLRSFGDPPTHSSLSFQLFSCFDDLHLV